jgi:hypothetical protein
LPPTDRPSTLPLELLKEAKLADLLGDALGARLEASGVLAKDGCFYVIFDNSPDIARIGGALAAEDAGNGLIRRGRDGGVGYEDIAYDRAERRFYVLVEALPHPDGGFMAKVAEHDERLGHLADAWLDFRLDRPNKGLEGLTCVRRAGRTYLLGLCEGNRCRAGAAGRRPGGGRIQVFTRGRRRWDRVATVRLPESLWFEDYSSLAVAGDRVAVVSQACSALWVGRLSPSRWEMAGEGITYGFPPDAEGRTVYCTVEGVSWVAADQVVVVSDKAKPGSQPKRCRATAQSIHLFALPGAAP